MIKKNRRGHFSYYNKAVQAFINKDCDFLQQTKNINISHTERNLLHARDQMRKQNWNQATEFLNKTTTGQFLTAEKYFLLGTSYFYQGDHNKAVDQVFKAYKLYLELDDKRGLFLSSYNMSVYLDRTGKFDKSDQFLSISNNLSTLSSEKLLVLRGYACKFSRDGNYEKAKKLVESITANSGDMSRSDQEAFYSVGFDILFRGEFYSEAKALLHRLKHVKISLSKERYLFEIEVLKILESKQSFDSCPQGIKSSLEYSLKWTILRNIQSGNITTAKKGWQKLHELIPAKLTGVFGAVPLPEEKSIFFVCLKQFIKKDLNNNISNNSLPKNKLDRLNYILSNSTHPLNKEGLIEAIWEDSYDPKYNARFYKLIERFKVKNRVNVICINGGYTLSV